MYSRIWMILLLFLSFNSFADNASSSKTEKIYTVGIVPQFDTLRTHAIWRPILDEVQGRTGLRFTFRGSATIPAFEQEFQAGAFDFAYMNPHQVLIASKGQGYIPLVRDTGRKLHGIIVVAKDSPIKSVTELAGKTIAFPAPNALGATLLARSEFQDKFNISVTPLYVQTHSSVYLNVALGETIAGGGVQKTLARQPEELQKALRIIYRTQEVAPHPFTAHPRVKESVRKKVLDALLEMSKTEVGRQLLKKVPVKRLGLALLSDYTPLEALNFERFYQNY